MTNKNKKTGRVTTHTDPAIYGVIKDRARHMRKNPTPAEAILWERLRRKQIGGLRFRRQHAIGRFIVDFYCAEARLVVEVDGSIHDEPEIADYDAQRQQYLEESGLSVLRFANGQVIKEIDAVVERISKFIEET